MNTRAKGRKTHWVLPRNKAGHETRLFSWGGYVGGRCRLISSNDSKMAKKKTAISEKVRERRGGLG